MTIRTASAAAIIAASVAALAAPASAQEVQSFKAWGHVFNVPGAQPVVVAAADAHDAAQTTGSIATERAYASVKAGLPAENASLAHERSARTINVWGARIDASVD